MIYIDNIRGMKPHGFDESYAIVRGMKNIHTPRLQQLSTGGTVRSEVLVEVFAKAERVRRDGGTFGDSAKASYRKQMATTVLAWINTGCVYIEDVYALVAVHLMQTLGLDYVDCLLGTIAMQDGENVATSDKGLIDKLGSHRWYP